MISSSCHLLNGDENEEEGEVIARVYDQYLYEKDLKEIVKFSGFESAQDSILIVQNYINVWAKNQLMLYKAEYNLNEEQKDFEKQINKYRNDLLKFTYQEEYIKQNLDTNISEQEIDLYYSNSKDNFLLKENIVIANYLIVSIKAPEADKAKKWFRSSKVEDFKDLKDYALKYATEFYLGDSSWVSFDKVIAKFPLEKGIDQSKFLTQNNFVELSDTNKIYLLKISDYRLKRNHAPKSYVKNVIQNILINKKKLELLSNLEKNLLEDALKKKEFETY